MHSTSYSSSDELRRLTRRHLFRKAAFAVAGSAALTLPLSPSVFAMENVDPTGRRNGNEGGGGPVSTGPSYPPSADVRNFLPSRNGLHYYNSHWPHIPDITIGTPLGDIGLGSASNGLCGGMVFVVRDLFEAGRLPPATSQQPRKGSPALDYLISRFIDSLDIPDGVTQYYEWMNLPRHDTWLGPHGLSWRTINDTMPRVRSMINGGHPVPLGLVCTHTTDPTCLGRNHQVLAYGYTHSGKNTTVRVYDPNHPGRDDVHITFDHSDPSRTTDFVYSHSIPHSILGFFTTDYSKADPAAIFVDDGPLPMRTMLVSAVPHSLKVGARATITVTTLDAVTRQPVLGSVSLNGRTIGRTNTPLPATFAARTVHTRSRDGSRDVDQLNPDLVASAAGYTSVHVPIQWID